MRLQPRSFAGTTKQLFCASFFPGSSVLITWHPPLIPGVLAALEDQLSRLYRGGLARSSLEQYGALVRVPDGKAAAQLSVSQPAISKAIGNMEHTLGVRLLDRSPQGVKPTIYASALLDHGVIAFDELHQAIRKIECIADPTVGDVRIGCSVVLAEGFVASVIKQFSQRYPRVNLEPVRVSIGGRTHGSLIYIAAAI